jgi:hypothetical protein
VDSPDLSIDAPKIDPPKIDVPPAKTPAADPADNPPSPADKPAPPTDDPAAENPEPPPTTTNEPPAETDPAATGEAPPQDATLVRGHAEHTPDELKAAIAAAKASKEGLLQGSLEVDEFKKAKVAAFLKFCKLADVYSFTKFKPNTYEADSLKSEVQALMLSIVDAQLALPDIEKISEQWIKRKNRPENGVILVGVVQKVEKKGKYYATTVRCGATGGVVILGFEKPFWKAPQTVLVAGTIVDDPSANVIGYEGDATSAIYQGLIYAAN